MDLVTLAGGTDRPLFNLLLEIRRDSNFIARDFRDFTGAIAKIVAPEAPENPPTGRELEQMLKELFPCQCCGINKHALAEAIRRQLLVAA